MTPSTVGVPRPTQRLSKLLDYSQGAGGVTTKIEGLGTLPERLIELGLRERVVRGDGNCQFRSLALTLYGSEQLHEEVRGAVIRQLSRKPNLYRDFVVAESYEQWLVEMQKGGTWGDHVTLKAAADAYKITICLITSLNDPVIFEILPEETATRSFGGSSGGNKKIPVVWLSFWAEIHYNALEPDPAGGGTDSSGRKIRHEDDDDDVGGETNLYGTFYNRSRTSSLHNENERFTSINDVRILPVMGDSPPRRAKACCFT